MMSPDMAKLSKQEMIYTMVNLVILHKRALIHTHTHTHTHTHAHTHAHTHTHAHAQTHAPPEYLIVIHTSKCFLLITL